MVRSRQRQPESTCAPRRKRADPWLSIPWFEAVKGQACAVLSRLSRRAVDGGGYEGPDRINGTHGWVRSRKHRGPCCGLLPIRQLSCRLRCQTWCCTAGTACRACRGDPRCRCPRRRSAAGNAHEPWWPGQSRRQALRCLVLMCSAEIEPSLVRELVSDGLNPLCAYQVQDTVERCKARNRWT
jgi:hypothetical protein